MEIKKLETKGEIIIERAENQFWAYEIDNENIQKDFILLDNIQFIYELSFAELELKALGVNFEVTNGLREFMIFNKSNKLIERIKKKSILLQNCWWAVYRLF